jgi:hypothetical protein
VWSLLCLDWSPASIRAAMSLYSNNSTRPREKSSRSTNVNILRNDRESFPTEHQITRYDRLNLPFTAQLSLRADLAQITSPRLSHQPGWAGALLARDNNAGQAGLLLFEIHV